MIDSLSDSSDSSMNIDPKYIDPEYNDPILEIEGGRKRKLINKKKQKKIEKNTLPSTWEIKCSHANKSNPKVCRVSELTEEDIIAFKSNLCKIVGKIDQDKFLLTMMSVSFPKRLDRRKTNNSTRIVTKYFIPTTDGENNMLKVCANVFCSITAVSRRRLNILNKTFLSNHSSPVEKRGGHRINPVHDEISESIKKHILEFKSRKSHHTRRDSGKSYLHPELSIKYLWTHWQRKRLQNCKPTASLSKYQHIFTTKFNLSFGHPRQDTCTFCSEQKIKISAETDNQVKHELELELLIHKKKAKRFFELLKETEPGSINCSFDMMQTQPIPKLSVTDVFYSRQVWIYNLTFVISDSNQDKENCILYTWNESDSGRGPNEVCSALIDFLDLLENRIKANETQQTTLNLFSDSCSGQNKNQYTMATLLYYINCKASILTKINHIFPVRGHSYMPPDRVFGRIEQVLRKKENIVSPNQYIEIFKNFCTVKEYNKDYKVYDFKNSAKTVLKTKTEFKSTDQKMYSYIKGKETIKISKTYSGLPETVEILKRKCRIRSMADHFELLPQKNHVKIAKQDDIRKLLKFFNIPEDAKQFYADIFKVADENIEDVPYYDEDND